MSPRVHAFGSEPHYREHVQAVWRHLPDQLRGHWYPTNSHIPQTDPNDVFLIGGFPDIDLVQNRRLIYVEHGAGQRYEGLSEHHAQHYHGSRHPNRVVAYISPRQEVADSWGRPAFAAGSPVCDPYPLFGEEGVVAITFHWDAPRVCPEARSAFDHYVERMPDIIAALRSQGYEVLGHFHPKFPRLERCWIGWGVPVVDVDIVRRRASLLIADNTSLMYEMAYLGRRTITLDAPWYRYDVDHGLRFWEHRLQPAFLDADGLIAAIEREGEHLASTHAIHNWGCTGYAYGRRFSDGNDGLRAASWVTAFVSGL